MVGEAALGSGIVARQRPLLAIVVTKPGADIEPERILDEVNGRMPHFAVPRYVRFVTELPKSPAQRIQKFKLRDEGLTADTWDREDHGYVVSR